MRHLNRCADSQYLRPFQKGSVQANKVFSAFRGKISTCQMVRSRRLGINYSSRCWERRSRAHSLAGGRAQMCNRGCMGMMHFKRWRMPWQRNHFDRADFSRQWSYRGTFIRSVEHHRAHGNDVVTYVQNYSGRACMIQGGSRAAFLHSHGGHRDLTYPAIYLSTTRTLQIISNMRCSFIMDSCQSAAPKCSLRLAHR